MNTIELKPAELTDKLWTLVQAAMEHGGVALAKVTHGAFAQDFNVVDLLEGPLWIISWRQDYRAIIRTRDTTTAWRAGVEFASKGGNPFAVMDPYSWSSDLTKTQSGKLVTTGELEVKLLSLDLVKSLDLTIIMRHLYEPAVYETELNKEIEAE